MTKPTPFTDRVKATPDGCLSFTGAKQSKGYGCVSISGVVYLAHRLAWELARGPIPAGLTVDHLCRNKVCLNPDHMEIVSREENSRRGIRDRTAVA